MDKFSNHSETNVTMTDKNIQITKMQWKILFNVRLRYYWKKNL